MKLADVDQAKLRNLLDSLGNAVEEMLLSGLTAASDATRKTLAVSFQETSRMRLLRLGSTLRVANEELGRFTRNEPEFSQQRLSFFLGRTWLLSRGLRRAVEENDDEAFGKLLYTPRPEPVGKLQVATIGVVKKHVKDTFCGFDFRLRTLGQSNLTGQSKNLAADTPVVWSCVFPLKPGSEIPPEGFLHLPQKQKFKPHVLLGHQAITIEHAAVARDSAGGGRVVLGEKSTIVAGEPFTDWSRWQQWDIDAARARLTAYEPGPFDLEIDLQEEVVLSDWRFSDAEPWQREGQFSLPIESRGVVFDLVASGGPAGDALREALKTLRNRKNLPPLYGLLHYQMGRLVLQPLTTFEAAGPRHLMISDKDVDRKALLAAIDF